MSGLPLHRPPRHPYVWAWLLAAAHLALVVVCWRWGWQIALPAMLGVHALVFWASLWPKSRLLSPVLCRLPTHERQVWLTIDDGPSGDTLAMLDVLDAFAAKATFFLVGERAAARPGLVREILARGHTVGNHSYTHPEKWFWALPPGRMHREIARTQATLAEISGATPRWFRAVVGMANPFVAAGLKQHGLARVAWSARGFDGVVADPLRVQASIERGLAPGAVVLIHEGAPHGRSVLMLTTLLQRLNVLGLHTVLPETVEAGHTPEIPALPLPAQDGGVAEGGETRWYRHG